MSVAKYFNIKNNFYKILFISCIIWANSAFCEPRAEKNKQNKTRITANVFDIKRKTQTIDFIGNVIVKNGPDSMTAHKMTVLYDDNAKSSKSQEKSELSARDSKNSSIKRIDAKQDVKVFSSDFVASSDFGHYNPKDNLFVLEKNVIVNNGDSVAVGEKFIYSLQTRKGSFVGKSGNLKTGEDKRVVVTIGKDAKKPKKKE